MRETAADSSFQSHVIDNEEFAQIATTPRVVSQRRPLHLYGLYGLYGRRNEQESEQQASIFRCHVIENIGFA